MTYPRHWEHTEILSQIDYKKFLDHAVPVKASVALLPNTAVYVLTDDLLSRKLEAIYDPDLKAIRPLQHNGSSSNRDLRLYEDAINNPAITVLAVDGLMGTGKTSSVIRHIVDSRLHEVKVPKNTDWSGWKPDTIHHKVLISKPHVNAGGNTETYGHLPGDINEKLDPTLNNFIQYFNRWHQAGFEALRGAGYIEVLPLGFIRGMDAENMDIIVDEAQNTRELITVVTRKANNSRVYLIGDTSPFQIDLPGNTPTKNGLTQIIDLLIGAPYFQYVEMKTVEHVVRSEETRDIVRRLFKKYGSNTHEWEV